MHGVPSAGCAPVERQGDALETVVSQIMIISASTKSESTAAPLAKTEKSRSPAASEAGP
jgi:hypothetical protein